MANVRKFGNYCPHAGAAFKKGSEGWSKPVVLPIGEINISPFANGNQYGQAVFEGIKFFVDDSTALLFRPELNHKRLNISCQAMGLPTVEWPLFMKAIAEVIIANAHRYSEGYYYVRPTVMNASQVLSPGAGDEYLFAVGVSPISFVPTLLRVYVSPTRTRTFPGGVGYAKAAGNYGNVIQYERRLKEDGYDASLYLDGIRHHFIEEIGTMAPMFILSNKRLIVPILTDTVIDSTTRQTLIDLAPSLGYSISEDDVSIYDIQQWYRTGELREAIGLGTASNVVPWMSYTFNGTEYFLPDCNKENFNVAYELDCLLTAAHRGSHDDYIHRVTLPACSFA